MRTRKLSSLLPYLAVDAAIIIIILLLAQIDWTVNHTLYNYGLTYSEDWAYYYWTALRIIQGLLAFAFAGVIILGVYSYKKAKEQLSKTIFICKSCGNALTRPIGNINIKDNLPNFQVLIECPSCNKQLLED